MADDLRIDTDGLHSGAAGSDILASALATGASCGGAGSQPSHGGVSAVLAAAESVRGRQSGRVAQQASDMRTAASRYDETDGHNATAIGKAM